MLKINLINTKRNDNQFRSTPGNQVLNKNSALQTRLLKNNWISQKFSKRILSELEQHIESKNISKKIKSLFDEYWQEYNPQIEELQKQIFDLKELRKVMRKTSSDIAATDASVVDLGRIIDGIHNEMSEKIEILMDDRKKQEEKEGQLLREIDKLKLQVQNLEVMVNENNDRHSQLEKNLMGTIDQYNERNENENKKQHTQIEKQISQAENPTTNFEEINKRCNDIEINTSKYNAEIKDRLEDMNAGIFEISNKNAKIENDLDHLNKKISEEVEHTRPLENDISRVEARLIKEIDDLHGYVDDQHTRTGKQISRIVGEIDAKIKTKQSELEEQIKGIAKKISEQPPQIKKINHRIIEAQKKGEGLQNVDFRSPFSAKDLVNFLREKEFFLSESKADEIIQQIECNKILVLKGVTGTGKSHLAELLAEIFLHEGPTPKFTQVNVSPEDTNWHAIGGLRMIQNHFAPYLGWLTEASIKSIEANGDHWLILDEINRGDISSVLAPVLDALNPDKKGVINHPNLFPEHEDQIGQIPIPAKFRIIGTMNPFDNDALFELTHAVKRRIGIVHIPPLSHKDELKLLEIKELKRRMKESGTSSKNLSEFKKYYHIDAPLKRVMLTIDKIRSISKRKPTLLYQPCELGTVFTLKAVYQVCEKCTKDIEVAKYQSDSIADEALYMAIISQLSLSHFSRQAIQAIRTEVFDEKWAKKCCEHLDGLLR
jgi:predicted  nucleic acid-binding Zn-ribbon protein